MSVGFGFSAGDLVAGLKIIKDSIEAVKDTKGASADYAALITEIGCLQDGFEAISDLRLGAQGSPKQRLAIERAIEACKKCVDDFMLSISKYQPHLHAQATGAVSSFRKIRWALCKKEDIALFRSKLERHTSSINMLLLSFQANRHFENGVQNGPSLNMTPWDRTRDRETLDLLQNLSTDQRQWFEVLMQQNMELMRNVQDLHRMMLVQMTLPPQVLLQQPVILLDAFGKLAPFHLEFIDSLESFTAVLKIRFRKAGVTSAGIAKIDNSEYTIQETRKGRSIDIEKPWSKVFEPGQEVDMSILFHQVASYSSKCPECLRESKNADEQIQCQGCGLCYQNIKPSRRGGWSLSDSAAPHYPSKAIERFMSQPSSEKFKPREPRRKTGSETVLFDGYRRVQVIFTSSSLIQANSRSPQSLEAFAKFVGLFRGATEERLSYLIDMREIESRIDDYFQYQGKIRRLSSAEKQKWDKQMAIEEPWLRHDMDQLWYKIRNDPRSIWMIEYLYQNHPKESTSPGSYTGMLNDSLKSIAHHCENKINDIVTEEVLDVHTKPYYRTKVKSKDQIQWMLLSSRGN